MIQPSLVQIDKNKMFSSLKIDDNIISVFGSGSSIKELTEDDIELIKSRSFLITLNYAPVNIRGDLNIFSDRKVAEFLRDFYRDHEKTELLLSRSCAFSRKDSNSLINQIDCWFDCKQMDLKGSFTLVWLCQMLEKYFPKKPVLIFGLDLYYDSQTKGKWYDYYTQFDVKKRGSRFNHGAMLDKCGAQLNKFLKNKKQFINCNPKSGYNGFIKKDWNDLLSNDPGKTNSDLMIEKNSMNKAQIFTKINEIKKELAFLIKKVSERKKKRELEHFLKNKKIILVGNSSELLKEEMGGYIDSFDIVVRMNHGIPSKNNSTLIKNIGKKTDIWICAFNNKDVQLSDYNSILEKPKYIFRFNDDTIIHDKLKPLFTSVFLDNFIDFRKSLGIDRKNHPSTGVVAIYCFLEYFRQEQITIIGYDSFKLNNFYEKNPLQKNGIAQKWHESDKEKKWIEIYRQEGRIEQINYQSFRKEKNHRKYQLISQMQEQIQKLSKQILKKQGQIRDSIEKIDKRKNVKEKNKLHILVPNYNNHIFMKNLMTDLLKQTAPFDLTILDNGSTDNDTIAYFEQLDSNRNHKYNVKINHKNEYLNHVWNNFYKNNSNKYLCFLSNDVRIPSNFIEDTISVFEREENVGIINHVTNNKEFQKTTPLNYKVLQENTRQGWDFTIRRALFKEIPAYLKWYCGDDFIFEMVFSQNFKSAVIFSSPMIHYQGISTSSVSHLSKQDIKLYRKNGYKRYMNIPTESRIKPEFDEIIDLHAKNDNNPNKTPCFVSMYTINTPYEDEVKNLIQSLQNFELPHKIYPIPNQGSWEKNCQQKAIVLLKALEEQPNNIVWVDADAVISEYPIFFEQIPEKLGDIAVYHYNTPYHPNELLSGTMFLRNNDKVRMLLKKWIELNKTNSEWDQRNLQKILEGEMKNQIVIIPLPVEYIKIQGHERFQGKFIPVIEHFQASRRLKRKITNKR
jgi:glycosyl transferase family 2/glycosyl transferase family 29 (putative sialyltransferase)